MYSLRRFDGHRSDRVNATRKPRSSRGLVLLSELEYPLRRVGRLLCRFGYAT